MRVVLIGDEWFVTGPLIGPFKCNADAWAWVDKHEGDRVYRPTNVPLDLWNTVPAVPAKKEKIDDR
jgi:hypothetical protein